MNQCTVKDTAKCVVTAIVVIVFGAALWMMLWAMAGGQ